MPRRDVPIGSNHLTMFIDVQASLLFFVVAAWEDDFTGYVIDYGSFPDQKRPYFTLCDARTTLPLATKASGLEGSIYAGLERLTSEFLGREWRRDDGTMLRVERVSSTPTGVRPPMWSISLVGSHPTPAL